MLCFIPFQKKKKKKKKIFWKMILSGVIVCQTILFCRMTSTVKQDSKEYQTLLQPPHIVFERNSSSSQKYIQSSNSIAADNKHSMASRRIRTNPSSSSLLPSTSTSSTTTNITPSRSRTHSSNSSTAAATAATAATAAAIMAPHQGKSTSRTTTKTKQQHRPFLRFVFGIFTMDSRLERNRRKAIRDTYLSYYKHYRNETDTIHQICSLQELLQSPKLQSSTTGDCQFVYTFILGGGNPETSPTELYWKDDVNSAAEMILPIIDKDEDEDQQQQQIKHIHFSHPAEYYTNQDMLFLNIKENMNDGKVPTWFQYGSALLNEQPELNIHYFGKLDSDTLVYPQYFFDWVYHRKTQRVLRTHERLYGGFLHTRERCIAFGSYCDSNHMTAPLFMTGAMVIVSASLSNYIGLQLTKEERQQEYFPGHEDIVLSNLIYHNETERNPIHAIPLPRMIAKHPLKTISRMTKFYKEHIMILLQQQQQQQKEEEEESPSSQRHNNNNNNNNSSTSSITNGDQELVVDWNELEEMNSTTTI